MKKVIRLTENDLTRIVKRVMMEQADENKVEVYGSNDDTFAHWDFPSLKTNPSVLYNLSISCTKNCQGDDFSVDKKGMKVNELKIFLGSKYDKIKYRNFLVKVDAIVNGKVVSTTSKEYGKETPSGPFTKCIGMSGAKCNKTF